MTRGVRTWMIMLLSCSVVRPSDRLRQSCQSHASARECSHARIGIRAALGGSRWDLSRVLLLERLILSLIGAAFGSRRGLVGSGSPSIRSFRSKCCAATIAVDLRVLATTGMLAVLTGVAFGMAPVVKFSRPTVVTCAQSLRAHEHRKSSHEGPSSSLVVAEVALAVVLLVGSGLFLESFARVTTLISVLILAMC